MVKTEIGLWLAVVSGLVTFEIGHMWDILHFFENLPGNIWLLMIITWGDETYLATAFIRNLGIYHIQLSDPYLSFCWFLGLDQSFLFVVQIAL